MLPYVAKETLQMWLTEGSWATSLVVQWLGLCTPEEGGPGLIPGRGTRSCVLHQRSKVLPAATETGTAPKWRTLGWEAYLGLVPSVVPRVLVRGMQESQVVRDVMRVTGWGGPQVKEWRQPPETEGGEAWILPLSHQKESVYAFLASKISCLGDP